MKEIEKKPVVAKAKKSAKIKITELKSTRQLKKTVGAHHRCGRGCGMSCSPSGRS